MVINEAMAMPKGRPAGARYLGAFVEEMKASGFVAQALASLVGFSSGGGFALRIAGGPRQDLFQSDLLLSPYLSHAAPTTRPDSGGWVSVCIPRIVGIGLLNQVGIHRFDSLPVVAFALNEKARAVLTPAYSYALTVNFNPHRDYVADIKGVQRPCALIAGDADEVFHADRFEPLLRAHGSNWPVTLLPGLKHIPLTIDAASLAKEIEVVGLLQRKAGG